MSYKTAVVNISRALNMHFVFKWQQVFSVVCNRPLTWCFFFVSWERPLCKVKLPHSGLLCRSLIMEDQCHNHVTSLYIHVHFILHCWGKKIWHLYIIIVLCTYIHGYLLSLIYCWNWWTGYVWNWSFYSFRSLWWLDRRWWEEKMVRNVMNAYAE